MKKTTREFPQSWIIDKKNDFGSNELSVIKNFSQYLQKFYETLFYIEKFDKKEFNKLSPISIEKYRQMFDERFAKICDLLFDKEKIKNRTMEVMPDRPRRFLVRPSVYDDLSSCMYFKKGTIEILEEDYFNGNYIPREMRFTDEVYPNIKSLALQLYDMEEMITETTNQMWKDVAISDIHSYDKNNYGMFVKVICDWRHEEENNEDIQKYMESRYCTSASYITNKKSKFFMQHIGVKELCGVVFSADGFVCANSSDAYLEEYIDNACPLRSSTKYSNVKRIIKHNGHDICADSVKFCTPRVALYSNYDNYNEVVLDKRKSKPIAVFYVDEINGEKVPNTQKLKETAEKLAFKFRVPVITLQSNNYKLSQDEEVNEN